MRERVEELRQQALSLWRNNEYEQSIPLLDEALNLATEEETRELLTINKAYAFISLEKTSPEVQALPRIILRRRNLNHVLLAAYALQAKFTVEGDYKRAHSYLRVALQAAEDSGDATWKPELLINLGILSLYDSRIEEAVAYHEEALKLPLEGPAHVVSRAMCVQNIGYCKLLLNDFAAGIEMIHRAISMLKQANADGYLAECYIDLCYGYLGVEQLDEARQFGEMGLSIATEVRQIRNAHYLLGEVAFKSCNQQAAETHFEHLATFYPNFPHLKDLLLAIDLRGMVNLKL